jgi:hypothetical protein
MQTIEQYLIPNGYAGANVTADGAASSELPYLVVGMPCQFIAHVVNASGAPATPAGLANVESWKFVLAGDFDPETAPCYTTDEIVWDAEECAWTVLLDGTRTASMLALLGDEPWVNIGCEVVGLGEDEDWAHPAYVLQWTARIRGRRDSDGLGIHPVTGERVANVLSADRGAELRMTEDGNLAITVPGASAPVVVTPAQIAAVAQNAITPEERAKWNDRERIVSANGKTELRACDGGSATLGVLDIHLGNAVATFPPGGGNFAVWTDDLSWQPKGATNTVIEFVGPYPGAGVVPRNYWVPKDGDQFTNYDPTAATSGWHLSAPNGATTPEVLQYRDGPGFTISGWETGEPTLEPLSGTNVRGTFWFARPNVDATDYRNVSKEGHTHEGVVHGDTELAAVNGGGAVIRRTQNQTKTCLASATLSWTYSGGGGQASGTVDLSVPSDEHVAISELAAGVESFRLHAKVWIVTNSGPLYGDVILTPNWFEGDCVATRDGATQGGGSHYAITSENGKLNGGAVAVESDGVTFFSWHDDWYKDTPVEVDAMTRTAQATRTDTVAVVTTSPVGNPETDKTLSVENKPADGKAVGDALALKADATHTHQLRYALVSPALATSGTTVSATLQDRAVNAITLASTVTAATFTFPAPVAGYARDFFLRLAIEGSTVPTISFLESGGGSLEDVFDADDDAWAEIEPGVNVLMFTETSQEAAS